MIEGKTWRNSAAAGGSDITTASTPLDSSQHHGTHCDQEGGRGLGDNGHGGAFVRKASASHPPGGEGDGHINIFSGEVQDGWLSHCPWWVTCRTRRVTSSPSLPVGVGQRGVVGEAAESPFGPCGAGVTSIAALLAGVEESPRRAARQPDTGRDPVLIGGLAPVGGAQFAKAEDGAVPYCGGIRGGYGGGQKRESGGTKGRKTHRGHFHIDYRYCVAKHHQPADSMILRDFRGRLVQSQTFSGNSPS